MPEFDISIPELDDLEELTSSSPAKLAITVERLTGAVKRLREINVATARTIQEQEDTIKELLDFKNEIKTGSKIIVWLLTGTIAIIGAAATFFSGLGTKLFTGQH
jgi:hypothetical protein